MTDGQTEREREREGGRGRERERETWTARSETKVVRAARAKRCMLSASRSAAMPKLRRPFILKTFLKHLKIWLKF